VPTFVHNYRIKGYEVNTVLGLEMVERTLQFCSSFRVSCFYISLFYVSFLSCPSLTNIFFLPHAHKIKILLLQNNNRAPITFNTLLPLYSVFMASQ